jgi:hypothetical protein
MFNRSWSFFVALAALLVASLACNLPGRGIATPTPPDPVPMATESVESLKENVQSAVQTAQAGGRVTLTMNEAQLTSLAATELSKQSELGIQNPKIRLRNGLVSIEAQANQSGLEVPVNVDLELTANGQGKPQFEVKSASLGPFPMPQSILSQVSSKIDQALVGWLAEDGKDLYIESITVADGEITITGYYQ